MSEDTFGCHSGVVVLHFMSRDTAKCPVTHRTTPSQQRLTQPQKQIVPRFTTVPEDSQLSWPHQVFWVKHCTFLLR
jgi:hypothetical protein